MLLELIDCLWWQVWSVDGEILELRETCWVLDSQAIFEFPLFLHAGFDVFLNPT
jgi:hypothetical protein